MHSGLHQTVGHIHMYMYYVKHGSTLSIHGLAKHIFRQSTYICMHNSGSVLCTGIIVFCAKHGQALGVQRRVTILLQLLLLLKIQCNRNAMKSDVEV